MQALAAPCARRSPARHGRHRRNGPEADRPAATRNGSSDAGRGSRGDTRCRERSVLDVECFALARRASKGMPAACRSSCDRRAARPLPAIDPPAKDGGTGDGARTLIPRRSNKNSLTSESGHQVPHQISMIASGQGRSSSGGLNPTVAVRDRWHSSFRALERRAQTRCLRGFAGPPAAPLRAPGGAQSLMPSGSAHHGALISPTSA